MTPSARKLIAVPLTIWSARRWIDMNAWTSAKPLPAIAAQTSPISHELNLSAPSTPKKAPASIIPSRPMFTTPLRSQIIPPIAAKVSGVAQTSVDARSADHTTTSSRFAALARVASDAHPDPDEARRDRPHPRRRTSRVTAQMPGRDRDEARRARATTDAARR